jgi:hypothetical protein
VHAENYGHAKTLLRAFACGLQGKNTARAPCVCLAIWPIFARRQHVEARTAGCKRAFIHGTILFGEISCFYFHFEEKTKLSVKEKMSKEVAKYDDTIELKEEQRNAMI